VIRFQGPRANGMPELHALTPALANLQDAGYHVAMVTDGRMSGASGKVPAAIHVSPEILAGGPLGLVRDGDIIRVDATQGTLEALVPADVWASRKMATADLSRATSAWAASCSPCSATRQRGGRGRRHFPLPSPIDTTVPLHEGADSGEIMPGSDEDFLFRKSK
jgi:phosphogluconate dehydratase